MAGNDRSPFDPGRRRRELSRDEMSDQRYVRQPGTAGGCIWPSGCLVTLSLALPIAGAMTGASRVRAA